MKDEAQHGNAAGAPVLPRPVGRGGNRGLTAGITDEDEIERLSLAYSPKFKRILDAARREIRKGKGIPHDEFWAEMEADSKQGRATR